jgi:hypothetical protein
VLDSPSQIVQVAEGSDLLVDLANRVIRPHGGVQMVHQLGVAVDELAAPIVQRSRLAQLRAVLGC